MTPNAHATGRRAVKAVIPAAGLATRFLPATKAVPKELLPVVDRPVLQYIVEEAAPAGITDVLLVTGRGKTRMVDHFDRRPDVEQRLEAKGDLERLAAVRRTCELADIYTCRQGEPLGLGHAVGVRRLARRRQRVRGAARRRVRRGVGAAARRAMLDLQARTGGIVLAFMEVPDETRYGVALGIRSRPSELGEDVVEGDRPGGEAVAARRRRATWPSLGRYILPQHDLRRDRRTRTGRRRRDPADRRDGPAAGGGHPRARHHLPRRPVRHRDAAGLPAGRGPARLPAARPRRGVPRLAGRVRRRTVASRADDGDGRCRGGRQRARSRLSPNHPLAVRAAQAAARCLRSTSTSPRRTATCSPRTCSRPRPLPRLRPGRDRRIRGPVGRPASAGRVGSHPSFGKFEGGPRPVRLNVVGDLAAASWRPVRLTAGHLLLGRGRRAAADRRRRGRPGHWTDQGMAAVEILHAPKRGHGVRRAGDELAGRSGARPGRLLRDPGDGRDSSPRRHRARGGAAQPPGGRGRHRRRAGRRGPAQPARPGRRRQLARAHRGRRRGGSARVPDRDLRRRPRGAAGPARGPDAAGRPDHHHRRHRHRARRHAAPGASRRDPGRGVVEFTDVALCPGCDPRLRHRRRRGGAGRLPARRTRAPR